MTNDKLSALISIFVAIVVLLVGFFQWWDITYDGAMVTKTWVKILFFILIGLLIFSARLIWK